MTTTPTTTALPRGRHLTEKQRAAAVKHAARRYRQNASIRLIAQEMGRSYGFVHRLLTDAGIQLRPRGGSNNTAQRVKR